MTDEIEHDKPDAITRLRAENERLGRDYQTARNAHDKLVLKNERLRAALEEIAKHPRGGRIDTPEKLERDEMIGIARAALEAPQRRIDTAHPAAPGGDA